MHNRLAPKPHRFHYDVFMFYVDLDELEQLNKKLRWFSVDRFNLFSFRRKEHLQLPADHPNLSATTRQQIESYASGNGIDLSGARIMLLTNMNILGYNFNPVSFYFCFDKKNEPICCIAEVSNTYREMKPYLLDGTTRTTEGFSLRTTKYFYVSPFIDHDTDFDFNLAIPGDKLNIRIDDYKEAKRFFISTLTGKKEPLTDGKLLRFALGFPLLTLRIMFLIHWHALRLWLKKLPYHKKDANQHLQQNVYKPYGKRTSTTINR